MTNVLIANDSFKYARNLMASINEISDQTRVCNIAISENEVIEMLKKMDNIDIILLSLKKQDYGGSKITENLSPQKISKYKDSIIVISEQVSIPKDSIIKSDIIYKILPKTLTTSQITSEVKKLIEKKEESKKIANKKLDNTESKIMNELLYLGYDISHKGTRYLLEIIKIISIRGEELTENLSKYVYPIIAQKHHQSINNIKCNILRATEFMYYNCEENKLKTYFLYSELYKPNIKTIIHTVLMRINK